MASLLSVGAAVSTGEAEWTGEEVESVLLASKQLAWPSLQLAAQVHQVQIHKLFFCCDLIRLLCCKIVLGKEEPKGEQRIRMSVLKRDHSRRWHRHWL